MPSTRTPEGTPNRCTLCGNAVWAEPSAVSRDAPCPHCGTLLWFADVPEGLEPGAAPPDRRPLPRRGTRRRRPVHPAVRRFLWVVDRAAAAVGVAGRRLTLRRGTA